MNRIRAADDFTSIRARIEELRRERQQRYGGAPGADEPIREPGVAARVPGHIVRRYLAESRRSQSR